MTVNELIEALRKYPPDMRVVTAGFDEYGYDDVVVSGPVEIVTQPAFAILSLDGVPVAEKPAPHVEQLLVIDWDDHEEGPFMKRSEEEIEKLLGWAQSSPEEAGREVMRLEDQVAELCQVVEAALNMVDGDGAPPRWDWMREVLARAKE